MNKIFLILILICFSCNAKQEKDHKKLSFDITNNQEEEYTPLKNETKTLQNEILVIKDFQKIGIPLSVIIFRESERSFLSIEDKYLQVELEYSIEDKNNFIDTNKILLFKKDKEYIILIPTYTEEFTTFQMISYSEKEKFKNLGFRTFGYSDFEKLKSNSINKFTINIKDSINTPTIYAEYNNIKINFLESYKNENSNIELTKKEKNNILLLRNKQNVTNIQFIPLNDKASNSIWLGKYEITPLINSEHKNYELEVTYRIVIKSLQEAMVEIESDYHEDRFCQGDYALEIENNILHGSSKKCTLSDAEDFYIKKENDEYFIKSRRFVNENWQELKKIK